MLTSRGKILRVLAREGCGMTPKRIAEATRLSHDNVRQLLRRMIGPDNIQCRNGAYYHSHCDTPKDNTGQSVRRKVRACLRRLRREGHQPNTIAKLASEEIEHFLQQ